MKKYEYGGKTYTTESEIRKVLFETKRLALGRTPTDAMAFWLKHGVVFTEEQEPILNKEPSLEELKQTKIGLLDALFNEYRNSKDSFIVSSLGFRANANVVAFNNITGLIAQMAYECNGDDNPAKLSFMTFDDELASLDIDGLKTLQAEISKNGTYLYEQKWAYRNRIQGAVTIEELNQIQISFNSKNFAL